MMMLWRLWTALLLVVILMILLNSKQVVVVFVVEAQQSYVSNHQLDCYNHFNATDGFVCNGAEPSCLSFLTFRPIAPFNNPTSIAYLLNSDPAAIASANNISAFAPVPPDRPIVVVPVNCSCSSSSSLYRHDAPYRLALSTETYFSVANNTYQGLTTCQSLMARNPSIGYLNLSVGLTLHVPLFCACPTPPQAASGVNFLLTYLVTWRDDITSIARRFHLHGPQPLWDANKLSSADIIFPFTPILVPLTAPPPPNWLLLQHQSPPPPVPAPVPVPAPPVAAPAPASSKKWIAIAVGASLLLAAAAAAFFFLFSRRRRRSPSLSKGDGTISAPAVPPPPPNKDSPSPADHSWSLSSQGGVRSAVDSMTLYPIQELQAATNFFAEANKIRGSVYRGSFKGDAAAVKVMKGDVSAEINILKRINHSNIVRLSGCCIHAGNTYLVYEYADAGSLSDCLRLSSSDKHILLGWKQRVEIAHDVADALNYLHNFADPPYIHKNLKTSNILLDANLRAKLSNFGLARNLQNSTDHQGGGGLHLTRHVVGTQGYLAPEYIENGLITPKLDVFAFGVVLLEILSGREAAATKAQLLSDSIRQVLQGDNVRDKLRGFIDPALRLEYPLDLAFSLAQLANTCVATDLNSRPNISQVFLTLSKIQSSSHDWDPSDELHRSTSLTRAR